MPNNSTKIFDFCTSMAPTSNGNVDVIEMKKKFKPDGVNGVDCMASSSFKNVDLTDENIGLSFITRVWTGLLI